MVSFYERRARGGAGIVFVEPIYLTGSPGEPPPYRLSAESDRYVGGLADLAEAISRHDALPFVRLVHAGGDMECDKNVLINAYARAADLVARAGFLGLEIHASPRSLQAAGALELIEDVVRATRAVAWTSTAIGVHIGPKALTAAGTDPLARLDSGVTAMVDFVSGPLDDTEPRITRPTGPPFLSICASLDPYDASELLAEGREAILVDRALVADPDLVSKLAAGDLGGARPCVDCDVCLNLVSQGRALACSVNPLAGHESEVVVADDRWKQADDTGGGRRTSWFGGGDRLHEARPQGDPLRTGSYIGRQPPPASSVVINGCQ